MNCNCCGKDTVKGHDPILSGETYTLFREASANKREEYCFVVVCEDCKKILMLLDVRTEKQYELVKLKIKDCSIFKMEDYMKTVVKDEVKQ